MAFTSVAAVLAGTATTAVAIAAVAEIGIALTVVGVVTGNEKLTKIGGVMSLVGGVGGVLAGSMTASEVAAGEMASGATGAAGAGASAVGEGAASAAADGVASGAVGSVANAGASTAMTPLADSTPSGVGGVDNAAPAAGKSSSLVDTSSASDAASDATTVSGPQEVKTPFDQNLGPAGDGGSSIDGGGTGDIIKPKDSKGFFSFLGDNKQLTNSVFQLGMGALKGASDRDMFDQKMALNREQLEMEKQKAANANAQPRLNFGINTNANVFGNQPISYSGIIAGKRN